MKYLIKFKKPLIIIAVLVFWFWEATQTYRHSEERCVYRNGVDMLTNKPELYLFSDAPFSFHDGFGIRGPHITHAPDPLTRVGRITNIAALTYDYSDFFKSGRISLVTVFEKSSTVKEYKYGWFSPECWQKVAAFRDQALPHVRLLTGNWPKDLEPIPVWKDDKNPFDIPYLSLGGRI